MRIYLGAFGDAGHAFPMLALGEALVARGHTVALQTWRDWEEHATAGGMAFAAAPEYQVFPTREQPLAPYAAAVRAARETVPSVRGLRAPTSSSPTSSPSRPRSPPSCAGSRPRRSSRTCSRGPRPGSRPTRSAPGSRGARSARAPGARSTRSWSAGSRRGRDEYNDCRARLGLPPLDRLHTALSRELTLVATLPQLEYPRDWPAWTRITGPLLWEPPGERVDPPPGEGPVVLVAPSTAQDPGHRMLRAALAGLARAPVRVIATYNGRVPDPPVDVPANAVLVPWLSYARTMPACDLVVTHGGHGTLVRALACGCPVVVCPAGGDMPENAARADWAGLGVRLPGRLLSARTLRLAVERALGRPELARAGRLHRRLAGPPRRRRGRRARPRGLDRPIRGRSRRVSTRRHPVEEAHMHLRRALVALLLLPLLLVVACGDDSDSGGSTPTGGGGDSGPAIEGAKVVDPASMDSAKGDITFCTGKDTTGSKTAGVKAFNAANPDMNVKMTEFPESADEQRNQFVQRQEAKSSECDVFYSDVIWTAEFAVQKWLYDMTPYVESRKDEFIPSTFDTATYQDKVWGVPHKTNAGFLYYRTDEVDNAAGDLAGRLQAGRGDERHRLPGRRL